MTNQSDLFTEESSAVQSLIDEFAELYTRLQPDLDKLKRLQDKVGNLAKEAAGDLDEILTLTGDQYCVDYSPATNEAHCSLDPQAFILTTGKWEAVKVSVTDARKALPPGDFDKYFTHRKGSRRLKRVRSK